MQTRPFHCLTQHMSDHHAMLATRPWASATTTAMSLAELYLLSILMVDSVFSLQAELVQERLGRHIQHLLKFGRDTYDPLQYNAVVADINQPLLINAGKGVFNLRSVCMADLTSMTVHLSESDCRGLICCAASMHSKVLCFVRATAWQDCNSSCQLV